MWICFGKPFKIKVFKPVRQFSANFQSQNYCHATVAAFHVPTTIRRSIAYFAVAVATVAAAANAVVIDVDAAFASVDVAAVASVVVVDVS